MHLANFLKDFINTWAFNIIQGIKENCVYSLTGQGLLGSSESHSSLVGPLIKNFNQLICSFDT